MTGKEKKETSTHQIITVATERLLLDPENPRLASTESGRQQEDILRVLWTEMAIDELVLSIAANGFFPEEPLFVIPDPVNADPEDTATQFVVVEGNRRLAAVKILLNDELREKLKVTALPRIDGAKKEALQQLPVSVYKTREELWTYLGFRHINSPKAWDSFSKARYIAEVHEKYGKSLDEIAERIGDRHDTVLRLYQGFKVLKQAEEQTDFRVEDRSRNRFYFSHLYTAVSQREYQAFLGIDDNEEADHLVPDDHLSQLEELMTYIYGQKSKGKEPIVQKQNPDLNTLRQVISKPESLSALRAGYPLAIADDIRVGDTRRFQQALTKAKEEMLRVKSTVTTGYDGRSEYLNVIQDIFDIAKSVQSEMRSKARKQGKD